MSLKVGDLTPSAAMLNGVCASFLNISLVHPLFTLKTMAMVGGKVGFSRAQLYLGYTANLGCDGSSQGVNFFTNNLLSAMVADPEAPTNMEKLANGFFSGTTAAPVLNGFERIMILRQIQYKDPVTQKICNTPEIVRILWQQEGPRAFLKGGLSTAMREGVGSACFFGLQQIIIDPIKKQVPNPMIAVPISYFISGAVAGGATTSADLIKTRMQQAVGTNSSLIAEIKAVGKEFGYRALFTRGIGERSLLIGALLGGMGPISEIVREVLSWNPDFVKKKE